MRETGHYTLMLLQKWFCCCFQQGTCTIPPIPCITNNHWIWCQMISTPYCWIIQKHVEWYSHWNNTCDITKDRMALLEFRSSLGRKRHRPTVYTHAMTYWKVWISWETINHWLHKPTTKRRWLLKRKQIHRTEKYWGKSWISPLTHWTLVNIKKDSWTLSGAK